MADQSSFSTIDLGLGGLGDMLNQQLKDNEEERKKKLLTAGSGKSPGVVNALGLGAINMLGGYRA